MFLSTITVSLPLDWIVSQNKHYQTRYIYVYPPDPINHSCSLTGKQIPENYVTYRSVQIFKILFPEIIFSRIWSSAQDYAVRCLLLNPVVILTSTWQKSVRRKLFVLAVYQFWKYNSAGPALQYFTWFTGAGGSLCIFIYTYIHIYVLKYPKRSQIKPDICVSIFILYIHTHTYVNMYIYVQQHIYIHIYIYIYVYMSIHTCIHIYTYTYMHAYIYMCKYIYIYISIYTYI